MEAAQSKWIVTHMSRTYQAINGAQSKKGHQQTKASNLKMIGTGEMMSIDQEIERNLELEQQ